MTTAAKTGLRLIPMTIQGANEYVARWHRHSEPTRSALFALACITDGALEPCGVAIVGRPKARALQDGATCEVVRLATDGTSDACSFLYSKARRAAQALGYRRCVTYTLARESGSSLRAVGAVPVATVKGRSWDTPTRPRIDKRTPEDRVRWELPMARGAA